MPERWRQLAALSLAELLALSLWFSASAVLPALQQEWNLGAAGSAGLVIAVQLGFTCTNSFARWLRDTYGYPVRRWRSRSHL